MSDREGFSGLTKVALIGVLTALACFGTLLIRIPIPATTGYFNLGDVFVMLAGLWLGPLAGLVVGAVGPAVADAIGFPQFILATAVTKGCEGLVVGLVAGRSPHAYWRKVSAVVLGGLVIVVGYFVFEALIYPVLAKTIPLFAVTDYDAALLEILPNSLQAVIAAVASLGLWKALSARQPPGQSTSGISTII